MSGAPRADLGETLPPAASRPGLVRVAVVDDEELVRDLIAEILHDRGYRVDEYAGSNAAYDALYDHPPQLLITDVSMPDGSGLELVARLRDRHGHGRFPVIVLSSLQSESDFIRGYAAGADEYLSKPFSRAELLAKTAVLLARTREATAGRRSAQEELPEERGLAFGRFSIRRVMGQGTYGTVYAATCQETGRDVALKVLSALQGSEPANRLRFLREAYALSAVRHANVVDVRDFGVLEGRLYYAMERVVGATLKDALLRDGRPRERDLVALLGRLASALAALDEANLVHRDIKPANILLRDDRWDDPVLVDFGLAKRPFDRGVTDPLTLMGTPGYIAPEVVLGKPVDVRSDIFSLGLVARFALTGREVFPDLRGYRLLRAIAEGPIPLPTCAPRLHGVLQHMLQCDVDERVDSAAQLERDLAWAAADPALDADLALAPSGASRP